MAIAQTPGCAAPAQGTALPASIDLDTETVITGIVVNGEGAEVDGAYVRLLDSSGEFTAEVVTAGGGQFRFFAAPGAWTLRTLSRYGDSTDEVEVATGLHEYKLEVSR
ncbi:DUF1416 domain-containing protein [Salininema proteolyticum]|uniref:DUF1416 domain-containing protein n=1 Tax=Salininema proteolyticum TaxID=1607685 RepID=A0ABV8TWQ7_9ACTN